MFIYSFDDLTQSTEATSATHAALYRRVKLG